MPVLSFYSEETFGGDLRTEAIYSDIEVECLIISGGLEECWDAPEQIITDSQDGIIDARKISFDSIYLNERIIHIIQTITGARIIIPSAFISNSNVESSLAFITIKTPGITAHKPQISPFLKLFLSNSVNSMVFY